MYQEDIELIEKFTNNLLKILDFLANENKKMKSQKNEIRYKSCTDELKLEESIKIDQLCHKNEILQHSIYNVYQSITSVLNLLENTIFNAIYSNGDVILTEDSYLQMLSIDTTLYNILQKLRFLSIPIYKFFVKQKELENIQLEIADFNRYFTDFLEQLKEIEKDTIFRLKGLEEVPYKKRYEFEEISNFYDSLSDILLEAISNGYPYNTYYDLAIDYVSKEKIANEDEVTRIKEDYDLERNERYVIERNGNNKEVLSLYDANLLLGYRAKLLEEMKSRRTNFNQDRKDMIKILKLDQVLSQRNE